MKTQTIIGLGILAILFSNAWAADTPAEPPVSKETVMKAIATFQQATDPFTEAVRNAGDIVQQFAQFSHDVEVKISLRAVPILRSTKLGQAEKSLLVQAFIVGNVNAQLKQGKKGDESYAGDKQMIETYHRMQQARQNFRAPEIETLADFEAKDELKTYLSLENAK